MRRRPRPRRNQRAWSCWPRASRELSEWHVVARARGACEAPFVDSAHWTDVGETQEFVPIKRNLVELEQLGEGGADVAGRSITEARRTRACLARDLPRDRRHLHLRDPARHHEIEVAEIRRHVEREAVPG